VSVQVIVFILCELMVLSFSLLLILLLCLSAAQAVDRSNFKTCDQSSFCKWVWRVH